MVREYRDPAIRQLLVRDYRLVYQTTDSFVYVLRIRHPRAARPRREHGRRNSHHRAGAARGRREQGDSRHVQVPLAPRPAIWRALVGSEPQATVRYASGDPFEPEHWWRTTTDAMAVSREWFGLLNAWAGFPVASTRGRDSN